MGRGSIQAGISPCLAASEDWDVCLSLALYLPRLPSGLSGGLGSECVGWLHDQQHGTAGKGKDNSLEEGGGREGCWADSMTEQKEVP